MIKNPFKRKPKDKTYELYEVSLFDFNRGYEGHYDFFGDANKWEAVKDKYESGLKVKGNDVPLELRKQILIKSTKIQILDITLFIMRNAFESFLNSGNDKYYLDLIYKQADVLIENGIKFNNRNNVIKEHNRCIKLIKNKQNDIEYDINQLKEATKGGITFDELIAIIGKWSGVGIINQRNTMLNEFQSTYNSMLNGK